MDTKWLIAIVIGNVIAAIVKESVSGFIKLMPAMAATLTAKLRPMVVRILRRYWRVGFDLLGMMLVGLAFPFLAAQFPAVTHLSVFIIAQLSAWMVFWNIELLKDMRALNNAV